MARLKVTWVKSAVGYPKDQKGTIEALGLKRLNQSVELDDSGSARGMILKVRHLVKVEAAEGSPKPVKRTRKAPAPVEEKS